jgi:hypothetical protein
MTRIELSRDSEAADLKRFVDELGLHARRDGTVVEILDASDAIGNTVTAWLAEWHEPLVPTELEDGAVALRPPAA